MILISKGGYLMLGAISPGKTIWGIPLYSVFIVSAIMLAIYLCSKEEKRLGFPKDTVIDMALWLIPVGIVGARLYYVAFEWDQFADKLISIFYVWQGGIAIYGALIGGLIAAYFFARVRRLSLPLLADMIFPTVALAQSIGRWGNYFNMEAYGEVISNPSFQFFPFGVLIPEASGYVWHLATFFYESVWDFGVFSLLWFNRKKEHKPGDLSLWYILLYGPGRAFIEGLRMDSLYTGGGLRVSQWISLIACFLASSYFLVRSFKNSKDAFPSFWAWCSYLPSVLGLIALFLSAHASIPLWARLLPSFVSLILLWTISHKNTDKTLKTVIVSLFPLLQLITLVFERHLDPLLFTTLQTALAGLLFPAVSYLLYPHTL